MGSMQKIRIAMLLTLCIFVYQVCSKMDKKNDLEHPHSKGLRKILEKTILKRNTKEGIYIATFIGDKYLAIKDGKLVVVNSFKDANLFDIDVSSIKMGEMQGVKIMPWVEGKQYVISFNLMGNDVNVTLPIHLNLKTITDITFINEVYTANAAHPAFQMASAQKRYRCVVIDPASGEVKMNQCAQGAERQTFVFRTYDEAETSENKKNGGGSFRPELFLKAFVLSLTKTLIMGSFTGVLYYQ
ncbi:hypothetical protein NEMIN01_0548 [Nematocida minor]|uniref:uncharacterized protein n=1 Tax=Nematocida minor TaxID=1912983 RepID=UPI002220A69A|nr:uncharacterized protein NEMIN01_0548 [Nematocida minor]KAI5189485.1 hypothetical protein NEMIN01_0548 [Nematocida minor]